jgi:nucleoside-diphosphate-sugar epimerase
MILVTGGTGLVGSHLLYLLTKQGKTVTALYRTEKAIKKTKKVFSFYADDYKSQFEKIKWLRGDLLDYFSLAEAMEGIEHVYHCAAMVSFLKKYGDEMMKINVEGTANVVNCALEKKIRKLCYVSSVAAFGEHLNNTIIDEATPWKGASKENYYAISKYAAEREVWRASEEGLDVVIVNPAIILGAGVWNESSSKIFGTAAKGFPFYPKGTAGYVDVRDVVSCMAMLMESDAINENYILSAENLSYKFFTGIIAKVMNKKEPSIKIGKAGLLFAAIIERLLCFAFGKNPNLTSTIRNAVNTNTFYSNKKIKDKLQFEFTPIAESVNYVAALYKRDTKF